MWSELSIIAKDMHPIVQRSHQYIDCFSCCCYYNFAEHQVAFMCLVK